MKLEEIEELVQLLFFHVINTHGRTKVRTEMYTVQSELHQEALHLLTIFQLSLETIFLKIIMKLCPVVFPYNYPVIN